MENVPVGRAPSSKEAFSQVIWAQMSASNVGVSPIVNESLGLLYRTSINPSQLQPSSGRLPLSFQARQVLLARSFWYSIPQ